MYSGVLCLVLVLLYHSIQVEGGCVSCFYDTKFAQCHNTYSGSYSDACQGGFDMNLCRRYGGGYSVYCTFGFSSKSCHRRGTACKAGSIHHAYPAALLLACFLALVSVYAR